MSKEKDKKSTNYTLFIIIAMVLFALVFGGYLFYSEHNRTQIKRQETITKCREVSRFTSKGTQKVFGGVGIPKESDLSYQPYEKTDIDGNQYEACLKDAGVKK